MMAKALLPFNYIILLVCLLTLSPTLHVFKEFRSFWPRWPQNYLLHTNGGLATRSPSNSIRHYYTPFTKHPSASTSRFFGWRYVIARLIINPRITTRRPHPPPQPAVQNQLRPAVGTLSGRGVNIDREGGGARRQDDLRNPQRYFAHATSCSLHSCTLNDWRRHSSPILIYKSLYIGWNDVTESMVTMILK